VRVSAPGSVFRTRVCSWPRLALPGSEPLPRRPDRWQGHGARLPAAPQASWGWPAGARAPLGAQLSLISQRRPVSRASGVAGAWIAENDVPASRPCWPWRLPSCCSIRAAHSPSQPGLLRSAKKDWLCRCQAAASQPARLQGSKLFQERLQSQCRARAARRACAISVCCQVGVRPNLSNAMSNHS